ncbi:MAG TPA: HAMP domain-containing sensor histidine kinase [Puia sp.]|nr:HAMP domain-containing sensor histidine kinase [Puia sp.]
MTLLQQLLHLGISDRLKPYERRRAWIFNYCNLAGFTISLIRLCYLTFFAVNHYPVIALLVNGLPMVVCAAMGICMLLHRYKGAIAISFIFFPPLLVCMAFFTNDRGLEIYLLLYLLFTFFFLHRLPLILATFAWILACFVCIHYILSPRVFNQLYSFRFDITLSIIDYSSGLFFLFMTMYFIKFEVWKFEKSIREKKEELRKLNAMKDKVFSVISHDLRTPVNSIILLLREMQKVAVSAEEFNTALPEILGNMEQTGDLLDNLLAWASSQIRDKELQANEISISKVTNQTLKYLERNAASKNIRLINEVTAKSTAFADESCARIVLRNLLANAIKFTASGGFVKVRSEKAGEFIKIIVEDNGIGIPRDKQPLLFSEGYYSTSGTNNEAGTGLGLLICKDLVQKNGGSLIFTSEVGNGSTFSFSLPAYN